LRSGLFVDVSFEKFRCCAEQGITIVELEIDNIRWLLCTSSCNQVLGVIDRGGVVDDVDDGDD